MSLRCRLYPRSLRQLAGRLRRRTQSIDADGDEPVHRKPRRRRCDDVPACGAVHPTLRPAAFVAIRRGAVSPRSNDALRQRLRLNVDVDGDRSQSVLRHHTTIPAASVDGHLYAARRRHMGRFNHGLSAASNQPEGITNILITCMQVLYVVY